MLLKTMHPQSQLVKSHWITPALIALTATVIVTCSSAKPILPLGYENDPLTIIRVLNETLNSQQYGGALSLFADDVALTNSSGETTMGKTSVLQLIKRRTQNRAELCDIWLAGNTVTWTVRMGDCSTAKQQAVVQDGKIQSIKWIDADTR